MKQRDGKDSLQSCNTGSGEVAEFVTRSWRCQKSYLLEFKDTVTFFLNENFNPVSLAQ